MKIVGHDKQITYDVAVEKAQKLGARLPGSIKQFWPPGLSQKLQQYCYENDLYMIWVEDRRYYLQLDNRLDNLNADVVDMQSRKMDAVYIQYDDQKEMF